MNSTIAVCIDLNLAVATHFSAHHTTDFIVLNLVGDTHFNALYAIE